MRVYSLLLLQINCDGRYVYLTPSLNFVIKHCHLRCASLIAAYFVLSSPYHSSGPTPSTGCRAGLPYVTRFEEVQYIMFSVWLQLTNQDGAPPHYGLHVREYLSNILSKSLHGQKRKNRVATKITKINEISNYSFSVILVTSCVTRNVSEPQKNNPSRISSHKLVDSDTGYNCSGDLKLQSQRDPEPQKNNPSRISSHKLVDSNTGYNCSGDLKLQSQRDPEPQKNNPSRISSHKLVDSDTGYNCSGDLKLQSQRDPEPQKNNPSRISSHKLVDSDTGYNCSGDLKLQSQRDPGNFLCNKECLRTSEEQSLSHQFTQACRFEHWIQLFRRSQITSQRDPGNFLGNKECLRTSEEQSLSHQFTQACRFGHGIQLFRRSQIQFSVILNSKNSSPSVHKLVVRHGYIVGDLKLQSQRDPGNFLCNKECLRTSEEQSLSHQFTQACRFGHGYNCSGDLKLQSQRDPGNFLVTRNVSEPQKNNPSRISSHKLVDSDTGYNCSGDLKLQSQRDPEPQKNNPSRISSHKLVDSTRDTIVQEISNYSLSVILVTSCVTRNVSEPQKNNPSRISSHKLVDSNTGYNCSGDLKLQSQRDPEPQKNNPSRISSHKLVDSDTGYNCSGDLKLQSQRDPGNFLCNKECLRTSEEQSLSHQFTQACRFGHGIQLFRRSQITVSA
ncbi:hypothetical protein J6590_074641 [Homalodisca vitripennis]|nr:hypothetical protein J6590_074641 [Homalodisca vitripennis]